MTKNYGTAKELPFNATEKSTRTTLITNDDQFVTLDNNIIVIASGWRWNFFNQKGEYITLSDIQSSWITEATEKFTKYFPD